MKAINQKIVDQDEIVAVSVNRSLLSVDYASASPGHSEVLFLTRNIENIEISDYLQEGDVGFKKPKVSSVQSPAPIYSPSVCRKRSATTISVSSSPPWMMPRLRRTATKRCR